MYEHFYGFKAKPFDHPVESKDVFLNESQKRALLSVREGLKKGKGFIVVTGFNGLGKTTLVAFLKKAKLEANLNIASFSAENIDDMELLPAILRSFKRQVGSRELPVLIAQLEEYIHSQVEQGKKLLLVVDEAHHLSYRSLSVLSLLSNFMSNGQSAFQVMLVGDKTLTEKLTNKDYPQLQERIISSAELKPMALDDTKKYVIHNLKKVGWKNSPSLNDEVFSKAQQTTDGIPSEVNQYFDRLLLREMMKSTGSSQDVTQSAEDKNKTPAAPDLKIEELISAFEDSGVQAKAFSQVPEKKNEKKIDAVKKKIKAQAETSTQKVNKKSTDNFQYSDGVSLEEARRAFEGGSSKDKKSWFNWRLLGVVVGSYLLSAAIAASIYYADPNIFNLEDSPTKIAGKGHGA